MHKRSKLGEDISSSRSSRSLHEPGQSAGLPPVAGALHRDASVSSSSGSAALPVAGLPPVKHSSGEDWFLSRETSTGSGSTAPSSRHSSRRSSQLSSCSSVPSLEYDSTSWGFPPAEHPDSRPARSSCSSAPPDTNVSPGSRPLTREGTPKEGSRPWAREGTPEKYSCERARSKSDSAFTDRPSQNPQDPESLPESRWSEGRPDSRRSEGRPESQTNEARPESRRIEQGETAASRFPDLSNRHARQRSVPMSGFIMTEGSSSVEPIRRPHACSDPADYRLESQNHCSENQRPDSRRTLEDQGRPRTSDGLCGSKPSKSKSSRDSRRSDGKLRSSTGQAWCLPGKQLRKGSRDDSFLPTISESRSRENSDSTGSKNSICSEMTVEIASESSEQSDVGVLNDFSQIFTSDTEQMQRLLRQYGFDKPLEMQRRVVPLVKSAFTTGQKSFIIIQGKPQSGKTSALVLGILGGTLASQQNGLRTIVLSSSTSRDFRKYFDICSIMHPLRIEYFDLLSGPSGSSYHASTTPNHLCPQGSGLEAGLDPVSPHKKSTSSSSSCVPPPPVDQSDLLRLATLAGNGSLAIFGHPSRVLPLLREAPSRGLDLSSVEVLALDDTEEMIQSGLIDEVCEVCTILKHFSKHRLRHIILSHFLSREARSMLGCLRNSLLRQQNFFGLRAHQMQAKAQSVKNYYVIAPQAQWPALLSALHRTLDLPSGIIFYDAPPSERADTAILLRAQGLAVSAWSSPQSVDSEMYHSVEKGRHSFFLTPSDPVVLKIDLPKVRCVLHFDLPRQDVSIYGLRLMCLEKGEKSKGRLLKHDAVSPKQGSGSPKHGNKNVSVLFSETRDIVQDLEKSFSIEMQLIPTEMLPT